MEWSRVSGFAFIEYDRCRRARFGIEVGKCSVGKNDPEAKPFLNDILDLFTFEIRKVPHAFDHRNNHSSECIMIATLLQA
jgi:hypothetical protein